MVGVAMNCSTMAVLCYLFYSEFDISIEPNEDPNGILNIKEATLNLTAGLGIRMWTAVRKSPGTIISLQTGNSELLTLSVDNSIQLHISISG